ncbi:MAG: hypothetical protein AAFN93_08070 [Bacteroidota bacterium]
MCRKVFPLILSCLCSFAYGQHDDRISTIDFVQILNDNEAEVKYYYENNWMVLRKMAIEKGYIHSYELMEVPTSEEAPFQLILITTYKDQKQYDAREEHFGELIKAKGELKLLNGKKPGEFRKTLFGKDMVRHWK